MRKRHFDIIKEERKELFLNGEFDAALIHQGWVENESKPKRAFDFWMEVSEIACPIDNTHTGLEKCDSCRKFAPFIDSSEPTWEGGVCFPHNKVLKGNEQSCNEFAPR